MDHVRMLHDAIHALRQQRPTFPLARGEAIAQEEVLYQLRMVWTSLPNARLKESEREAFVAGIIGSTPSDAHLALAQPGARRKRLSTDERMELESRQCYRCALCGVFLDRSVDPHVDHIVPVSFGGLDNIENFQLLCGRCNIGKSNSLHWLMIAPIFYEAEGVEPSAKARYCALQRHAGCCAIEGCASTSKTDAMHVIHKVPVQLGGRTIFDNLTVVCDEHKDAYIKTNQIRARNRLKGSSGFSSGFRFS